MRRRIPSFSALQAFEAAGRLLSFSRAADELFVTQGAISRQIRALEDELGTKLFERLPRAVELTNAGQLYLREVQFVLNHIERATIKFRARRDQTVLTISTLPSVASFWIMPRLAHFSQQYPEIGTHITTSLRPVDLHSGEADLAIRVGPLPGKRYSELQPRIDLEMVTNWRGVQAIPLFPDVLVPVLAPALQQSRPVTRSEHVLEHPLIHTSTRRQAWPDWLRAHGLATPREDTPIEYGHFFMSLEAARDGQGIAIVPSVLLTAAEKAGLVAPIPPGPPSAGEYHLLMLGERAHEPPIAAFREWLVEQADIPG